MKCLECPYNEGCFSPGKNGDPGPCASVEDPLKCSYVGLAFHCNKEPEMVEHPGGFRVECRCGKFLRFMKPTVYEAGVYWNGEFSYSDDPSAPNRVEGNRRGRYNIARGEKVEEEPEAVFEPKPKKKSKPKPKKVSRYTLALKR